MFPVFVLLQATFLGVSALNYNMSSRRLGKVQLLEDLRAHRAFKEKVSPAGDDNVVNIELRYCHYEVLMVDEVEQSVLSVGYIDMTWTDPDLAWDKTEYGGVDTISVHYNEIWHPSIRIANTADPDYMMVDRAETASLSSSGNLRYVTPVHLKTTCDMDLIYYPFDTQICDIFFIPLFDDVKQNISAHLQEVPDSQVKVTGQWLVKSKSITKLYINIADIEVIRFVMVIQRRPVFYILCVLTPMILTASVTSVVFWIPPSTGEKISFLVTVFVSDAVFLNFIAELMPRNMTNVPRLPLFLIIISLQCMFALLATIFVMRRYNQEQKDIMFKNEQVTDMKNKIFIQREEAAQDLEPSKTGRGNSHFNASYFSYIFDKLSFPNVRIGPLEKANKSEKKRKVQRKCRICPLKSSTWDMIFFWLFHAVTIPTYYMVFKV